MKYNFDEVIDREKNRSAKYDEREKKFGTRDVIPMWIADMDFRTAQPIIDAAKKRRRKESGDILPVRLPTMRRCVGGRRGATAGTSIRR